MNTSENLSVYDNFTRKIEVNLNIFQFKHPLSGETNNPFWQAHHEFQL